MSASTAYLGDGLAVAIPPLTLPPTRSSCTSPAQTLVTDQHEEMADAKEDGTPMPLAHYNIGDGSHLTLRIHVSAAIRGHATALQARLVVLQHRGGMVSLCCLLLKIPRGPVSQPPALVAFEFIAVVDVSPEDHGTCGMQQIVNFSRRLLAGSPLPHCVVTCCTAGA